MWCDLITAEGEITASAALRSLSGRIRVRLPRPAGPRGPRCSTGGERTHREKQINREIAVLTGWAGGKRLPGPPCPVSRPSLSWPTPWNIGPPGCTGSAAVRTSPAADNIGSILRCMAANISGIGPCSAPLCRRRTRARRPAGWLAADGGLICCGQTETRRQHICGRLACCQELSPHDSIRSREMVNRITRYVIGTRRCCE